jgi:chromosome segregation ATPase
MLSQQRQIVELRDLQLQQERESVRTLRASLRDEQRTKRDLEGQYEAINSELLVRNTREATAESRMSELERELSELNVSLNSSRSENERLVQDIHQVRYVTVFCTLPKIVLDQSC